jgi:hypothetical protein
MIAALMHPRRFAGIDEHQSFVVLDEPRVDRDPIGPVPIDQHVTETREAPSATRHLRDFDANRPGTDRVNFGHQLNSTNTPAAQNVLAILAYSDRPFIPNGDWLGNVWMPLNELTVLLRSGKTSNRLCAPAASV